MMNKAVRAQLGILVNEGVLGAGPVFDDGE